MKYNKITHGIFIERPNRFIAYVRLAGTDEAVKCHVKNTGRCKELLIPGAKVVLEDCRREGSSRTTDYDLIAVYKDGLLINMDSQSPNEAAFEWVCSGMGGRVESVLNPRREVKYGNSRFDIYYETDENGSLCRHFLEVKGVTLEDNGIVRFPDAPTERGIKHINELAAARKEGYDTGILFVIQMEKALYFEPNYATHKEFGEALCRAAENGVHIKAMLCHVEEDGMWLTEEIPVKL